MKLHILAVAAVLGLSACASSGTTPTNPVSQFNQALAQIGTFTIADLQAADAEAVAANDVEAHACFPALVQFVQSFPVANGTQTISGAFSAFEAARITRIQVQGAVSAGVPTYLKMGCSALVLDEQTFVLKLAALAGVASVAAPIVPAVVTGAP